MPNFKILFIEKVRKKEKIGSGVVRYNSKIVCDRSK